MDSASSSSSGRYDPTTRPITFTSPQIIDLTSPSPEPFQREGARYQASASSIQSNEPKQQALASCRPGYCSCPFTIVPQSTAHNGKERETSQRKSVSLPSDSESTLVSDPRYVYVLQTECRINVGLDESDGSFDEMGDPGNLEIGDVYESLEDGNEAVREKFEDICEEFLLNERDATEEFDECHTGAMILLRLSIDDLENRECWTVALAERILR